MIIDTNNTKIIIRHIIPNDIVIDINIIIIIIFPNIIIKHNILSNSIFLDTSIILTIIVIFSLVEKVNLQLNIPIINHWFIFIINANNIEIVSISCYH